MLKDEINILKGEKKRPVFKGSKLNQVLMTHQNHLLKSVPDLAKKVRPKTY